jgi:hypothetical protein
VLHGRHFMLPEGDAELLVAVVSAVLGERRPAVLPVAALGEPAGRFADDVDTDSRPPSEVLDSLTADLDRLDRRAA